MDAENDMEREANYIQSLGREIVRECSNYGLNVPFETVYHLIKLKALNPRNGFSVSNITSRSETQKFVRICVNELLQTTPAIDCIRMQAFWHRSLAKLDTVKDKYREHVTSKAQKSVDEIVEEEKEKVFKKIALFINEYTDIGNSNVAMNIKETINPLKSVFKQKDMVFLLSLTDVGQFEYLKILAKVVAGIRLHQYYYKRGSENVDNVPQRLISASQTIQNEVRAWLDKLTIRIQQLNQELCCIYRIFPGMPKYELPTGFEKSDVFELQQIQHIMLQLEIYLKYVLSFLEEYTATIQELVASFVVIIEDLNQVIGNREVIPTSEVYDRFTNVCESYMNLQAENSYLLSVNSIVKTLSSIGNMYMIPTKLETVMGFSEREPWAIDQWEMDKKIPLDAEIPGVTQLNLTDETVLQFRGYCVWTMISTNGLLIPARANLGILKFRNSYYGFATSDAADAWRYNAELNTRQAYEVIRTNAEMVDLLDMFDFLNEYRTEILVKKGEQKEMKVQAQCTQTMTHPIKSFFDKDYAFSEWQLKLRALQLSRIIKSQTKSVQTVNHSHFRASIGVQCKPDKTKETNTKKDAGCVHERPLNYHLGLRGTAKFQQLNLTSSVEGTQCKILLSGDKPRFQKECP